MNGNSTAGRLLVEVLRSTAGRGVLSETVDWPAVAAEAERHGLAPFLYRRLRDAALHSSSDVDRALHESYLAGAAVNMRLLHELTGILRALQAVSVPVIPLKGAFLAEAVYGDIALRPMADLDLLVRPADLRQAAEILGALGYQADYRFDEGMEQAISQHMPPMKGGRATPVELHWTLVNPDAGARIGAGEIEGIWSRAEAATVAAEKVVVLSPVDQLLHLCMHASVHHLFGDVGLRAFVDIAEVVRHYDERMDWQVFSARANQWGVANGVRMALMLAEEWTDLRVPGDVWRWLDGSEPDTDTLEWAKQKVLVGAPPVVASQATGVASGAGVARRLRTLYRSVFPSRPMMARIYSVPGGSWRAVAYYPYRLWDLWKRYRGAMWKLLRGDHEFVDATRSEARLREYLGWR